MIPSLKFIIVLYVFWNKNFQVFNWLKFFFLIFVSCQRSLGHRKTFLLNAELFLSQWVFIFLIVDFTAKNFSTAGKHKYVFPYNNIIIMQILVRLLDTIYFHEMCKSNFWKQCPVFISIQWRRLCIQFW